jgi:hypothetical protein
VGAPWEHFFHIQHDQSPFHIPPAPLWSSHTLGHYPPAFIIPQGQGAHDQGESSVPLKLLKLSILSRLTLSHPFLPVQTTARFTAWLPPPVPAPSPCLLTSPGDSSCSPHGLVVSPIGSCEQQTMLLMVLTVLNSN